MKKFSYEVTTNYVINTYETVSKVYADIPAEAQQAIAKAENWNGNHWDNPCIVYTEHCFGETPSDFFLELIDKLHAVPVDSED